MKTTLSPRERTVLGGLIQGKCNREIADELHVSAKTVASFRARVMIKLAVQSRSALVASVLRRALCSHCQEVGGFMLPPEL
jgi:FixJ family two-component response regulator